LRPRKAAVDVFFSYLPSSLPCIQTLRHLFPPPLLLSFLIYLIYLPCLAPLERGRVRDDDFFFIPESIRQENFSVFPFFAAERPQLPPPSFCYEKNGGSFFSLVFSFPLGRICGAPPLLGGGRDSPFPSPLLLTSSCFASFFSFLSNKRTPRRPFLPSCAGDFPLPPLAQS